MRRRDASRLLGMLLLASVPAGSGAAQAQGRGGDPPIDSRMIPRQTDTPQAILQKLMAGNGRYMRSQPISHTFAVESRAELAAGQAPAAAVLCCADSRVGPELIFDQPRESLFVCRVAGNIAPDDIVGSLEYAVKVLGSKLVVVLGHSQCGAVKAAIELVRGTSAFPPTEFGRIGVLAQWIAPAVRAVEPTTSPSDLLARATDANALLTADALRTLPPILAARVRAGSLAVVPARYAIETGRIDLL